MVKISVLRAKVKKSNREFSHTVVSGKSHFALTIFFYGLFAEGLGCSELGSMEADPDDCGSFLICNHNEYQKMACRDGTHYDPQVKVCNHPDQVKCEVGGNSVKPIRIRLEK